MKLSIFLVLTVASLSQALHAYDHQKEIIKDFYTKIFLLPAANPLSSRVETDLSVTLKEVQKHTAILKQHFFLSIIAGTTNTFMRCEIPDPSAPGGKMIVSGQLQIKAHNNLFKIVQACCSDLDTHS
jgi:hypothetical protein